MKRLLELTLFELVDALRRGNVSREDVVDAYLSRIKEVDSKLHAYLAVNEEMRSNSSSEGLLFNAPIAIKDNISTRGLPTTCASKILEGYIPPYDATTVARIKAEGGLILARLTWTSLPWALPPRTAPMAPPIIHGTLNVFLEDLLVVARLLLLQGKQLLPLVLILEVL